MLITLIILTPLVGIFLIVLQLSFNSWATDKQIKISTLFISVLELIWSLIAWVLFDINGPHFQFVQEKYTINYYDFYVGIDGLSIYFLLLTTFIIPISILSNWKSIGDNSIYYLMSLLLLESLLLIIFSSLDGMMFYIFFESILAPLFIVINMFGSQEKARASFYFFLYTFLGSLYMLLTIISMSSSMGTTDYNMLSRSNFFFTVQIVFFIGIFIAFAVKTPVIYLNGWLLKAHVESPLSGSILLAAVVLKLSLYGIFRLILPILPKAYIHYTYLIFVIGGITVLYASFSTIRTIDIKELIAYSSVAHAAVYFSGVFSNVILGLQGSILLGLAHGFVSSGLFTSAGGVLYDRSHTRLISLYAGITQAMPIFSILFFILCLGNSGTPLTLNFVGEFMSIYGVFERLPLSGIVVSLSIIFSAAFTIFMFNRICFGGGYSNKTWVFYIPDVNLREHFILFILTIFTVILGIYPSIILNTLDYFVTMLLYSNSGTNGIAPTINGGETAVNGVSSTPTTPFGSPRPSTGTTPVNEPDYSISPEERIPYQPITEPAMRPNTAIFNRLIRISQYQESGLSMIRSSNFDNVQDWYNFRHASQQLDPAMHHPIREGNQVIDTILVTPESASRLIFFSDRNNLTVENFLNHTSRTITDHIWAGRRR